MTLISAFMITGCSKDKDKDTETVAVKEIVLSKTTLTLLEGGSETLTATISPAEAENKSIKWTSSNEAVATVSSSGEVTAIAAGTATIIVTTVDGGKTATCAVTVVEKIVPVESVNLNKTALTLEIGTNELLAATIAPATATTKSLTWESDKPAVASVDIAGRVTAVAAGSATISVTADGGKTAKCVVTVPAPVVTSKVRINDGAEQTFTTGKLPEKLTGTVTKIVFSEAEINGSDVKAIMALSATLKHLDLTKATIVEGGEAYYYTNTTKKFIIGLQMFMNMEVLETALLPTNTKEIDNLAFGGSPKLNLYNIPEGVTLIGYGVFNSATMKTVTLPASLEDIDCAGTFGFADNINVASGNTTYKSISGVVYSFDGKTVVRFPINRTLYTVPEGVTTLGLCCFDGADKLTSLSLPASLNEIMSGVIRSTGLTELVIPANVNKMAYRAISQNDLLKTVVVNATLPPVPVYTNGLIIDLCPELTAIYVPNASVAAYKAADGWKNNAAIIKPISEKP